MAPPALDELAPFVAMLGGYRATRDEAGTLTVHAVPIFVECERGKDEFDGAWLAKAVGRAKEREAGGYFAPLHVRHHEDGTEVRPAGFFRVLGIERIVFRGEMRSAIVADLVVTYGGVAHDVLQKRLPWRSVEIHDVGKPSIDSLALLDHEAPFLELPMLFVASVNGSVPGGTLDAKCGPTVAASFRRGVSAALLFKMADDDKKPDDETKKLPPGAEKAKAGDGDDDAPPKAGNEGGEQQDAHVAAVVEAITSGSISVADFAALVEAIKAKAGATGDETQAPGGGKEPARAPAPGQGSTGQQMKKDTTMTETKEDPAPAGATGKAIPEPTAVQMAAMSGEIDGLKAKLASQEAATKRAASVAVAMKRLADKPLGSDLESKLLKFHADFGEAAFTAYVDAIDKAVGALPDDGASNAKFVATKASAVAMKYQDKGADAVEKAANFCAQWKQLREKGMTRMTEERFVEINMAENPLTAGLA